jgi:hypothetical protein
MTKRPALGIIPRFIYEDRLLKQIQMCGGINLDSFSRSRLQELKETISRRMNNGDPIDPKWTTEYNELTELLNL